MLSFQANVVSVECDENEVRIIGFTDLRKDGEPDHYFMIQQAPEYDEQDVALGMDTYYIERDSQEYGTYGGIQKISLTAKQISMQLDEVGQKHLEVSNILIGFNLTAEEYNLLKQQLKKIFNEQSLDIE